MKDLHYTVAGHADPQTADFLDTIARTNGVYRSPGETDARLRERLHRMHAAPRQATQRGLEAALMSIPGVNTATLARTDIDESGSVELRFEVRIDDGQRHIDEIRETMHNNMPAGVGWVVEVIDRFMGRERLIATVTGPV